MPGANGACGVGDEPHFREPGSSPIHHLDRTGRSLRLAMFRISRNGQEPILEIESIAFSTRPKPCSLDARSTPWTPIHVRNVTRRRSLSGAFIRLGGDKFLNRRACNSFAKRAGGRLY